MNASPLQPDDVLPWIETSYDPAQGPGGQHVNRAHTRATISFDLQHCPLLSQAARQRVRQEHRRRLTKDGRLRIVAQDHRERAQNQRAALERLCELLNAARTVRRRRVPTRPTRGSKKRRLQEKRQRGETKRARRPPHRED